jgi:hypothetical protein
MAFTLRHAVPADIAPLLAFWLAAAESTDRRPDRTGHRSLGDGQEEARPGQCRANVWGVRNPDKLRPWLPAPARRKPVAGAATMDG